MSAFALRLGLASLVAVAACEPERDPHIVPRPDLREDRKLLSAPILQQTVDSVALPFRGMLVAYIQGGSATVVTGGRRQERSQGQIWTIPPGASLAITTGRDAVSLRIVLVETSR